MTSFKELFTEMAMMKGSYDKDTFSHEDDWIDGYNPKGPSSDDTKLIGQNSKGLKLYRTDYILFLTDSTDTYLGSVEYVNYGRIIHIETAHSKMKKGFYKNLFELIFKKKSEIRSDHVLSKLAFKAYSNLTNKYKIQVIDRDGTYYPFTKENLFIENGSVDYFDANQHDVNKYYRTISVKK